MQAQNERLDPAADATGSGDAVPGYPGGKSGAGIFQRLINLIPPHRVLISAFAGKCGVVRQIKPAEHTIVIDADERVCEWWASWRRSKAGRAIGIHHCDSIDWLRHRFGLTEYYAARFSDPAGPRDCAAEAVLFCDPPYVLSERAHGKQYNHELTDGDHVRLLEVLTRIDATAAAAAIMVCGYPSPIYASLEPWISIDHRVPTRGGLQDERIWMNYKPPHELHDYRYLGNCRRSRERIRRRQVTWREQLRKMEPKERAAMLEALK